MPSPGWGARSSSRTPSTPSAGKDGSGVGWRRPTSSTREPPKASSTHRSCWVGTVTGTSWTMPSDLLSIAEVRSKILATVPRLASETVGLADLAGRVLAEPVRATEDVPGWDNSGMDGYAVRADDVATAGAVLEVIGDIPAGGVAAGSVGPGQAFKVMTGAPMPDGADTVVRVEDTSETEGRVTIRQAYESGTYVRPDRKSTRLNSVTSASRMPSSA